MLKCKEIVEIVSSNKELTFKDKVEVRIHLLMCKHCHAYSEQLKIMGKQYKKVFEKITKTDVDQVQKLEDKIIEDVRKKHENNS